MRTATFLALCTFAPIIARAQTNSAAPVAVVPPIPTVSPAPQTSLSLEDSIRIALKNHCDIGAAEQSFLSAQQGITSARAARLPQVSGDIGTNYNNSNSRQITSSNNNFSTSRNSFVTTTGISVSQNLFDGGRTRAQIQSAQARALGAVGGVGSARSNLAYEVARNFYEQLRQEKLVAQRENQVALARQQLAQIQAQIEAGTAARVDSQSVQVNLSQARFDLATALNDARIASTNFRNSIGVPRGAPFKLQESAQAFETSPIDSSIANSASPIPLAAPIAAPIVPQLEPLETLLLHARNLRPDLLQGKANVQSGEAALALAKIQQRPQISATAGYNIDPRSVADRGFQIGAGVSIPIFDAGGRKADTRAATADLEASKIRLAQLQRDADADVEAAYVDIRGNVDRIANARELVAAAQTNLATAVEKYRAGLGIVLDIVNAQTQLFAAQTSATQAVYDYELARANLDRAVGRFAFSNPGAAVPASAPQNVKNLPAVIQTSAK